MSVSGIVRVFVCIVPFNPHSVLYSHPVKLAPVWCEAPGPICASTIVPLPANSSLEQKFKFNSRSVLFWHLGCKCFLLGKLPSRQLSISGCRRHRSNICCPDFWFRRASGTWISESTLDSEAEGFRDFKGLLYYDCRCSYVQTCLYVSHILMLLLVLRDRVKTFIFSQCILEQYNKGR